MKLRKYLLLLAIPALLLGCGKDDEEENGNGNGPTTEEKITGEWKGVEYQENFYENGDKDTLHSFTSSITGRSYDFKADGMVDVFQGNDLIEELEWSVNASNNLEMDGLEYDILKLDENDFEVRHTSDLTTTNSIEIIYKWRK